MKAGLSINKLVKRYGGNVVTNEVSLDFPAHSLTAIIGPNGAGKTTLLNLITGIVLPDSGSIRLGDQELAGRGPAGIVAAGVGRAFQVANLFPSFSVQETLAACVAARSGELRRPYGSYPSKQALRCSVEIAELVGLQGVLGRPCTTLSHGNQKLLDIAIALAREPQVLLLDEPMAGMGQNEREAVVDCIERLWKESGMTLIFVEHDMDVVFSTAKEVVVMQMGAVIAKGPPQEIRTHPRVVEAYLGSAHE